MGGDCHVIVIVRSCACAYELATPDTHPLLYVPPRTKMAKSGAEVESVESLLDAAGQRALSEHELSEVKRILYGNPAQ